MDGAGIYFPVRDFPWMKWYPSDWLVNTRTLTLAAKGAWIDIITALHDSKTYGKMSLSVESWARVIGANSDETGRVLTELENTKVADVVMQANGFVMVACRRMLHEENAREKNRQRVARHREAKDDTTNETHEFRLSNGECNGGETEMKRGRGQRLEARDQIIRSRPEPNGSDGNTAELPKENQSDGHRFVEWFLNLITETGGKAPKLTANSRDSWAECYEKLLRLDGHTKDDVKQVCRWARNDSFWRANFMSPMKLREKKDGVSYFDQFVNKMQNPPANGHGKTSTSVSAEPDNRRFT
jgi:hypothetical protein